MLLFNPIFKDTTGKAVYEEIVSVNNNQVQQPQQNNQVTLQNKAADNNQVQQTNTQTN